MARMRRASVRSRRRRRRAVYTAPRVPHMPAAACVPRVAHRSAAQKHAPSRERLRAALRRAAPRTLDDVVAPDDVHMLTGRDDVATAMDRDVVRTVRVRRVSRKSAPDLILVGCIAVEEPSGSRNTRNVRLEPVVQKTPKHSNGSRFCVRATAGAHAASAPRPRTSWFRW